MNSPFTPLRVATLAMILTVMTLSSGWANPTPTPTPTSTIPNAIVHYPGKALNINLSKYYTLPLASTNAGQTNTVVAATSMGNFLIQLFPTNTPATVANFLNYATNGYYNNMLLERLVSGFVLQTGSYQADQALTFPPLATNFGTIPSEAGISNLTGTLAMALSTGPDSATSAWFINLANNASQLDGTNDGGPFTVFGQVVSNTMPVVSSIAALTTYSYNSSYASLTNLPLTGVTSGQSSLYFTNLVVMNGMQLVQAPYTLSSQPISSPPHYKERI